MREQFAGYYPLTSDEEADVFLRGEVILDTSVLLNLYRYSPATRHEMQSVLESVHDRLWLPWQVASEFQDNRLGVIAEQRDAYENLRDNLDKGQNALKKALSTYTRHPVLDRRMFEKKVEEVFQTLGELVSSSEQRHGQELPVDLPGHNDPVRDFVTDLYSGRVGERHPPKYIDDLRSEAEDRYKNEVPPGYLDAKKSGVDHQYGDLIIWKQIMLRSQETGLPVVFVTDDRKEDWWWEVKGKRIGPRPELIEEFRRDTGNLVCILLPDRFMQIAGQRLKQTIEPSAIEEVRSVGRETTKARMTAIKRSNRANPRTLRNRLERELLESLVGLDNIEERLQDLHAVADTLLMRQEELRRQLERAGSDDRTSQEMLELNNEYRGVVTRLNEVQLALHQTKSELAHRRHEHDAFLRRFMKSRTPRDKESHVQQQVFQDLPRTDPHDRWLDADRSRDSFERWFRENLPRDGDSFEPRDPRRTDPDGDGWDDLGEIIDIPDG